MLTENVKPDLEQWVKAYQCGDTSFKKKILAELAFFIRHFPRMAHGERDEDVLSEFYLFFYNNLDRVLNQFDPNKSSFWTFLSRCLSYSWYNFNRQKTETIYEDFQQDGVEGHALVSEPIAAFSSADKIDEIFQEEKDPKKRLILKLYFFDYFNEQDLILLKKIANKSSKKCLQFLDNLMEEILEKKQRYNALESRLTGIQGKILAHQRAKLVEANNWNSEKQKELDDIQDRYIKLYQSVVVHPSFKTIGDFLGLNKIDISNTIHRFKYKVRKQYKEKSFEKIINKFS